MAQNVKKRQRIKFSWPSDISQEDIVFAYSKFVHGQNRPRYTVCGIIDRDLNRVRIGVARCAKDDRFCYVDGKDRALNRARKSSFYFSPSASSLSRAPIRILFAREARKFMNMDMVDLCLTDEERAERNKRASERREQIEMLRQIKLRAKEEEKAKRLASKGTV